MLTQVNLMVSTPNSVFVFWDRYLTTRLPHKVYIQMLWHIIMALYQYVSKQCNKLHILMFERQIGIHKPYKLRKICKQILMQLHYYWQYRIELSDNILWLQEYIIQRSASNPSMVYQKWTLNVVIILSLGLWLRWLFNI